MSAIGPRGGGVPVCHILHVNLTPAARKYRLKTQHIPRKDLMWDTTVYRLTHRAVSGGVLAHRQILGRYGKLCYPLGVPV